MIKFLWHLIVIVAKHQGIDYMTTCWFKKSDGMNIVGYRKGKRVFDYYRKRGEKWQDIMTMK